jgi:diguanylate cyclase (GGDEF)-like protein
MSEPLRVHIAGEVPPFLRASLPILGAALVSDLNMASLPDLVLVPCADAIPPHLNFDLFQRHGLEICAVLLTPIEANAKAKILQKIPRLIDASIADSPLFLSLLAGELQLAHRIRDFKTRLQVLEETADRDHLTGLLNMRSFHDRLEAELARARRYRRTLSIVMMDVDNFKRVNDQNDHVFGSYVLAEVGRLIRENVRQVDFAARFGGDEFVICLNETAVGGARQFTERLRQTLASHIFQEGERQISITGSFGITMFRAPVHDSINARELVRAADQALYRAKAGGKNCLQVMLPLSVGSSRDFIDDALKP